MRGRRSPSPPPPLKFGYQNWPFIPLILHCTHEEIPINSSNSCTLLLLLRVAQHPTLHPTTMTPSSPRAARKRVTRKSANVKSAKKRKSHLIPCSMSMPNRPVTEPTKAQRLVWCVGVMGRGIQIVLQWWVRVGLGHNRASCAFAGWA